MPPQSRNTDQCLPEPCYPPSPIIGGAGTVFTNSLESATIGSPTAVHCCGNSCHDSAVSSGSGTLFIEGNGAARVGDDIACGQIIASGSYNVITGD